MERNPYSPPQAPVEDRAPEGPPRERPRQVLWASWLLWASVFVGLASLFLGQDLTTSLQELPAEDQGAVRTVLIVIMVVSFTIYLWFIDRVRAGTNWARIWLLILMMLGIASDLMPGEYEESTGYLATRVVDVILQVSAMVLIFTKPGSDWFRPRT